VPGAVYREVRSAARSTVDLAMRTGFASPLADNFIALLRTQIGQREGDGK